jgi:hypothetical protein
MAKASGAAGASVAAGAGDPQALRTIIPNNINKTSILKRVFILCSFKILFGVVV